jgi:hypothetical protein
VELFKITCVTCRAGLSVRNEALIGQIIACPKCGSMVEVSPPSVPETPIAEASSPVAAGPSYALLAWSVMGVVVGAALFGAILLWPTAPAVSDATSPQIAEQAAAIEAAPTALETTDEPAAMTSAQEASVESETPEPQPLPPQEPFVTEEAAVVEAPSEIAKPQAGAARGGEARVARRFNPLDLDPEGLELSTLDDPPRQQDTRVSEDPPPSPEPVASTQPVVRRGADAERNLAARDAKTRFSRRLPALSVKNMALVDFISLLSQLGGVPVSVGSEQLLMAGISPRQQVSLDAQDITLDAALVRVLDPLRLEHEFQGPQVVVVRQGADQVREIEYPINDLGTSGEELAAWLKQIVAPTSWQVGALKIADGSLSIKQTQRVHYQVLMFLERLRLMSGMSPRSRYPVQRLAPTPLHGALAERLAAPGLFTFSRETPLADVFLHWQREIDVPLLVDWPALAEVDLWPESTIVCAVADQTWSAALDEVLEPLGLDWRATFGGAIEISSAERLHRDMQLDLYPLRRDKAADSAAAISALKEHLSPTEGDLIFDPAVNVLIARQPASAQRQILAWLVEHDLIRVP